MKILFETLVGSRLYGISNEFSDFDYKGFGFPELDGLFGLKKELDTARRDEQITEAVGEGKDKVETVIYTVGKFVRLLYYGNPTILEIAFADKRFHRINTEIGQKVINFAKENFLVKSIYSKYLDYYDDQVRKLQRVNREGKRQELIDEFGYDTKFASHAYRLGVQCCEIMRDGRFNPTLCVPAAEVCKTIRAGEWKKDYVLKTLLDLRELMVKSYLKTTLPDAPDYDKINQFLIDLHREYVIEGEDGKSIIKKG